MLDRSSRTSPAPLGDPLADILRGLRLEGVEHGRCRLTGDWAYRFEAASEARFHFVGERGCWLRSTDGDWMELRAGDAVLVARGVEHVLANHPGTASRPFPRWECRAVCDNVVDFAAGAPEDDACVLFWGSMRFNLDPLHPLLRMMPDIMRVDKVGVDAPAIPRLLAAMSEEMCMSRIGAGGILAKLADVLAAQIIRAWVERGCGDATGWLAAMRSPGLGGVLAAIHAAPERDWSVAELARLMGTSRSSFAEKFATVVGETPVRYVAQVRMHQARRWLVQDGVRVSEAARRLGFESDASFSRAFKRVIGVPPMQVRARAR